MIKKSDQARSSFGKSIAIAQAIDYKKDSVVSKTLIQKNTGTITLFSFDKGQSLSEHTAPFDAFVHVLDGKAKVIIAGSEHFVKRGEYIIMPAHKPHALEAVARFKMLLVLIK